MFQKGISIIQDVEMTNIFRDDVEMIIIKPVIYFWDT